MGLLAFWRMRLVNRIGCWLLCSGSSRAYNTVSAAVAQRRAVEAGLGLLPFYNGVNLELFHSIHPGCNNQCWFFTGVDDNGRARH